MDCRIELINWPFADRSNVEQGLTVTSLECKFRLLNDDFHESSNNPVKDGMSLVVVLSNSGAPVPNLGDE